MAKVSFFIDGFNVYHSLIKHDTLADVFYFSAYAYHKHGAVKRHKLFVRALENTGVKVILGKFKEKDRYCTSCKSYSKGHEEKQTDVNIAIHLIREAYEGSFDKAILITNDTDLIPAIRMVKNKFPKKRIGILFPIDRHSNELDSACDFSLRTWKKNLRQCQFPNPYTLPDGTVLNKPATWINRSFLAK